MQFIFLESEILALQSKPNSSLNSSFQVGDFLHFNFKTLTEAQTRILIEFNHKEYVTMTELIASIELSSSTYYSHVRELIENDLVMEVEVRHHLNAREVQVALTER